jgi:F-type H+-transporting ATPase subunit gamma
MKRREVESSLALYDDLSGILGAMRSFALAELHRVLRREEAQQAVTEALGDAWRDMAPAWPPPPDTTADIWLLLGSVRGFCGAFNEEVIQTWRNEGGSGQPTVVVGERLCSLIPATDAVVVVPGALGGLDAASAIDRILDALRQLRGRVGEIGGLVACLRDKDGPVCKRLLPLPQAEQRAARPMPATLQPPMQVAAQVAEQILFHDLLALLLRSIRIENHMRLMQMENALRHLEQGREELLRQRNHLRQEEIIEEIEVMVAALRRRSDISAGMRG